MASAADRRKAQNRGVKAGTVRIGAKGKTVRRYNAKTGRWDVTKKNVKPGVPLRPVKSESASSANRRRGGYTGGRTTMNPPAVKKSTRVGPDIYKNKYPSKVTRSAEGPKGSRTENYSRFGFRTPGSRQSITRVIANKPSDFPAVNGVKPKLQLVKHRNKDSRGRDVYRWAKVVGK